MDMHVQGVLNGWSIGFDPVQYSERREPPEGKPDDEPILTLHLEKWELLEYSSVDIPADPYAMTQALESAVKTGRLTQEQIDGWRGRQCRGCGRCQEPPETQQPAKQPAEAAVDPLTAFGRLTVTTQRRV
jgi:hypothetical protein